MLGGDSVVVIPMVSRTNFPKKYVKEKCTYRKLIGVKYKVNTFVEFEEIKERYYENKIFNNKLVYVEQERIHPKVRYGFQVKIELSKEEFDEKIKLGQDVLNSYILDKAKNTEEYNECLLDCLGKENTDRRYHIQSFVVEYEFINERLETEEYLPVK